MDNERVEDRLDLIFAAVDELPPNEGFFCLVAALYTLCEHLIQTAGSSNKAVMGLRDLLYQFMRHAPIDVPSLGTRLKKRM